MVQQALQVLPEISIHVLQGFSASCARGSRPADTFQHPAGVSYRPAAQDGQKPLQGGLNFRRKWNKQKKVNELFRRLVSGRHVGHEIF
jgi:hypothetical protein